MCVLQFNLGDSDAISSADVLGIYLDCGSSSSSICVFHETSSLAPLSEYNFYDFNSGLSALVDLVVDAIFGYDYLARNCFTATDNFFLACRKYFTMFSVAQKA